jgi:hypothetical protein
MPVNAPLIARWLYFCGLLHSGIEEPKAAELSGVTEGLRQRISEDPYPARYANPKEQAAHDYRTAIEDMMRQEYREAREHGRLQNKEQAALVQKRLLVLALKGDLRAAIYLRETIGRKRVPDSLAGQIEHVKALMLIAQPKDYVALAKYKVELEERLEKEKAEKLRRKGTPKAPQKELEDLTPEAIGAVRDILYHGTPEQKYSAALTVLDRTGYGKSEKREFSGEVKTGPNWPELLALAESIKEMSPEQLSALDPEG